MIKIDVEGMEVSVIKGGRETLRRHKPTLYVEYHGFDECRDLTTVIDSFGYQMYWHIPPFFNEQNFYENKQNIFSSIHSDCLLCMHSDKRPTISGLKQAFPGEA